MKQKKTIKLNGAVHQWDSVFRRISSWDADKVASSKILVVGAGALGNEVLKNLALLNVGQIIIVDFDHIEYSNLSRSILYRPSDCGKSKAKVAAAMLRTINPNVKVDYIIGDIGVDVGLGIFRRVDVVIGCLDNLIARRSINRLCHKVGKTWVDGAIENLAGQMRVYQPGISCFECQLDQAELDNIKFRESCADVFERNSTLGRTSTTPLSASIIGALQVQEAIKVVLGYEDKLMNKEKFWYEGMNNAFFQFPPNQLKEDCISHVDIESNIIELDAINSKNTIGEVLGYLRAYFDTESIKILFNTEIVLEVAGSESQVATELIKIKDCIRSETLQQLKASPSDILRYTKSVRKIDSNFPKMDLKLEDIGVPPLQVLEVVADKALHFVELTGDKSFLNLI